MVLRLISILEPRNLRATSTFCVIRLCDHGTSCLIFVTRNCALKKMDGKSGMPNNTSSERAGLL